MGLNITPGGPSLPVSIANGGTGQASLTSLPLVTPVLGTPTSGLLINTTFGSETGLTAHAGGTQAAALVLSTLVNFHVISTCATNGNSVIFGAVAAAGGMPHYIRNDGAKVLQIYGSGTDTINGVATATGVPLPAGNGMWFIPTAANKWVTNRALDGGMSLVGDGVRLNLFDLNTSAPGISFWDGGTRRWDIFQSSTSLNFFYNPTGNNGLSISSVGTVTFGGAIVGAGQALSGAGAVDLVSTSTAFTSTAPAHALTLANGTNYQIKTVSMVASSGGGTGVLTPTTKSGYTTITFNAVGDAVTLQYFPTAGWCVVGSRGATIA